MFADQGTNNLGFFSGFTKYGNWLCSLCLLTSQGDIPEWLYHWSFIEGRKKNKKKYPLSVSLSCVIAPCYQWLSFFLIIGLIFCDADNTRAFSSERSDSPVLPLDMEQRRRPKEFTVLHTPCTQALSRHEGLSSKSSLCAERPRCWAPLVTRVAFPLSKLSPALAHTSACTDTGAIRSSRRHSIGLTDCPSTPSGQVSN